jgi:hypothetical protein
MKRLLPVLLVLAAACDRRDTVAIVPSGQVSSYCQGSGPAIITGDGITVSEGDGTSDDVCSGAIARRTFRFALCTCEGYTSSVRLDTDSFASADGPYDPSTAGAAGSVGVNGDLQTNDVLAIHGSLWSGATASSLGTDLTIDGDLVHQGDLTGAAADVSVGHDANLQGNVQLASLAVAGALTVPSLASVSTSGAFTHGTVTEAAETLADPCACAGGDLVDIARFVELHAADNDDAALGLSPAKLAAYGAGDASLDLPCGRYYLDAIDGGGALTLRIHGRTALFVGTDLHAGGGMTVTLDAGAELDLFVGNLLASEGDVHVGSPSTPARARVYVGGTGAITLTGTSVFAGNLYAPRAQLMLSGPVELYGSLFVRRLEQAAPVTIHYDTSVLDADVGCPSTGGMCQTCLDCPAQACNGGTCGACQSDADCCAPLECVMGSCLPQG